MTKTRKDPAWFHSDWARLASKDAGKQLCELVQASHELAAGVGGLFNAYEKALQYQLQTGLFQKDILGTRAEVSIPGRGGKCDLVVPLQPVGFLWLELKLMWFADGEPHRYTSATKVHHSPRRDWLRLRKVTASGDRRGVLVLCGWDDSPGCRRRAQAWLTGLSKYLIRHGARRPAVRPLSKYAFTHGEGIQRFWGKVACWTD